MTEKYYNWLNLLSSFHCKKKVTSKRCQFNCSYIIILDNHNNKSDRNLKTYIRKGVESYKELFKFSAPNGHPIPSLHIVPELWITLYIWLNSLYNDTIYAEVFNQSVTAQKCYDFILWARINYSLKYYLLRNILHKRDVNYRLLGHGYVCFLQVRYCNKFIFKLHREIRRLV
jgi:hypothetical protein